jgi:outer membrane protein TolC
LISTAFSKSQIQESDNTISIKSDSVLIPKLSLKDCIELAKKNNHFYPASDYKVKIAEAQYRQARSTDWPSVSLNTHIVHMDKDPMMVNAPTSMNILGMNVDVPIQNVKLMDKDLFEGTIELIYPLFTGGKISSIINQADNGVEIANFEAIKTDIEVISNVKKMYFNVLLTKILYEIANDANIKIDVTNKVTEKMFEEGSGTVLKTDYLKSKLMAKTFSSVVKSLEYNAKMAKYGLKNALGLKADIEIDIFDDKIPYKEFDFNESELISVLFKNHPDWGIVNKGLEALDAQIDEAYSDLYPKIALFGNYNQKLNAYDYGMVSPAYKNGWNVGVALQMSVFQGFLTNNRIDEAKARYSQLIEQQKLLENGLVTKLNVANLKMKSAIEQEKDAISAMETAIENRDLNERAYQADLVEAQDMITAQIMESVFIAKYQLVLFDYQTAKIELEALLGTELEMINIK